MSTNDEPCALCNVNHHAPNAPKCRIQTGGPMPRYRALFIGRKKGAIGIFQNCVDVVRVEGKVDSLHDEARGQLYEKWEHIQQLKLVKLDE
jgi:hypothetical protein